VLADDKYRARLLRKCTDKETRPTWTEFDAKDARQQAQEIGSLQNEVAALADPLPLRYVLGQPTSTIFQKIIERGTVLIVDLSDPGDEPAAILSAIIINAFQQAADAVGLEVRTRWARTSLGYPSCEWNRRRPDKIKRGRQLRRLLRCKSHDNAP
jgi:hypothetical protein